MMSSEPAALHCIDTHEERLPETMRNIDVVHIQLAITWHGQMDPNRM